jgi:hypothetical protein
MRNNHLRVVGGSTSKHDERPVYSDNMRHTGIVAADGRSFYVTSAATADGGGSGAANPPTGNGGDDMKTPFENLKQNVKFLNWALAAMFFGGVALIGSLHLLLDGKIEGVRKDVVDVQKSLAAQEATLNAIDANVSRLIERDQLLSINPRTPKDSEEK